MQIEALLQARGPILSQGSIYERLRRDPSIQFDPHLANAALIYDRPAAATLEQTYREYLEVGQNSHLPMVVWTSTWRANWERIDQAGLGDHKVNQDNAQFVLDLRASYGTAGPPIFVGGLMGPRGDAYRPENALSATEAAAFHASQSEALAGSNVDLLYAATLPAFSEAQGLARAMAQTGLPYVLSFVIRESGALLDGTPLHQAIEEIDATLERPPTGFAVNCVHPTVLLAGLAREEIEGRNLTNRIVSYDANTSAKRPEELDGAEELETEEPDRFGELMAAVRHQYHIPILGGCCGTATEHIRCLADHLTAIAG